MAVKCRVRNYPTVQKCPPLPYSVCIFTCT